MQRSSHYPQTFRPPAISRWGNFYFFHLVLGIISGVTAWLIGQRDISLGSDTANYIRFFVTVSLDVSQRISEPLFLALAIVANWLDGQFSTFFFLVAFISLYGTFFAYWRLASLEFNGADRRFISAMIAIVILPFWPFFSGLQVNIIRFGAALPFIYLAFLFTFERRFIVALTFALVALAMHNGAMIILSCLPLVLISQKRLLMLVLALAVGYVTGTNEYVLRTAIPDNWLALIANENLRYLDASTTRYQAGVRLDFLSFSLFFLGLAYWWSRRRRLSSSTLSIYAALLVPFLLAGFVPYSDRLLSAAWILPPLMVGHIMAVWLSVRTVTPILLIGTVSFPVFYFVMVLS